jgi:hypothetical protein
MVQQEGEGMYGVFKKGGLKMKVILRVEIDNVMMTKEYEPTTVCLWPDIMISDPVWKKVQQPSSIICDFEQGCYYLDFKPKPVGTIKTYENHNWKRA